jgi:hypothetical protein
MVDAIQEKGIKKVNNPSRVCTMAGSGPRRSHPAPSQPPAVARVTPLVPEVSLFLHSGSGGGGGPMPRYGGWNNNYDNKGQAAMGPPLRQQPPPAADKPPSLLNQSSGLMSARARPPSPHQPLLQGILKPMQDFSRLFDSSLSVSTEGGNSWLPPSVTKESASVVTRGGIISDPAVRFSDRVEGIATQVPVERPARSSPSHAYGSTSYRAGPDRGTAVPYESAFPGLREAVSPQAAARVRSDEARLEESPAVPPEILRVLNWQNEQLKLLQEQVKLLLESSPRLNNRSESTLRQESPQQQHQPQHQQQLPQHQLPQHQQMVPEVGNSGRMSSTVATNTSTLWPEIQQGLARLQLIVEQEEEGEEGDESSNYGEINKENIPVSSHFLAT